MTDNAIHTRAATFVVPCWLVRIDPAIIVRAAASITRTYARERQFAAIGPLGWMTTGDVIVFVRDETTGTGAAR